MLFCGKIMNQACNPQFLAFAKIAAKHNGAKKCSFHHRRNEHNDKETLKILMTQRKVLTMNIDKRVLSATEAAVSLGVSTQTVYVYIASGRLDGFKFSGHNAWRITEEALMDFIRRQERDGLEEMRKNQLQPREN